PTSDMIAHFHQNIGGQWQIYFRSRPKANHSKALALLELIAYVRPCDNAASDCAGKLPNDECSAGILKAPGQRFILFRALRTARIETNAFATLTINNSASHRRAVGVNIEDRQEDSNAACFRFQ